MCELHKVVGQPGKAEKSRTAAGRRGAEVAVEQRIRQGAAAPAPGGRSSSRSGASVEARLAALTARVQTVRASRGRALSRPKRTPKRVCEPGTRSQESGLFGRDQVRMALTIWGVLVPWCL